MKRLLLFVVAIPLGGWALIQTPPRIRGTVDLTIGGEDVGEEYTFGRVSSVALGKDGRIYVADEQDQQIRVYSEAGKYLFAIGRKGSGPGEFTGVAAMAFAPDGALWVRDEGANSRYQSFTISESSGRYRSTVRMSHATRNSRKPLVFDARGNVVEIGGVFAQGVSPYRIVRETIGSDSRVIAADTTREPPADSIGVHLVRGQRDSTVFTRYFYQPFPALPVVAHAPNGEMARAMSSRYAVLWTSFGGQRLRLLHRDVQGPTPTADERRKQQEFLDSQVKWARELNATLPAHRMPDRKPPIAAMQFSQDGELWIERTVATGQPREADIYDRNGRFAAIAEWGGVTLLDYRAAISGRTAVAVAKDSLDVERIVRLRFK